MNLFLDDNWQNYETVSELNCTSSGSFENYETVTKLNCVSSGETALWIARHFRFGNTIGMSMATSYWFVQHI